MRVSVYLVLFLLFFNAGAVMLESTGIADTMGIQPAEGNSQELEEAKQAAESPDPGNGIGGTLFGLYNSLAGLLETIFDTIFPGAAMLKANGFPDFFINFCFSGASIVVALDIAGYFRGYPLV